MKLNNIILHSTLLLAFCQTGISQIYPNLTTTLSAASVQAIRQVIPFPTGINGVNTDSCVFTRDGSAILCTFLYTSGAQQLSTIMPDGNGYQCLSCSANLTGNDPDYVNPLPDGKSVFFATTTGLSTALKLTPQILECSPSILNCTQTTVRAVNVPAINGTLNSREPRITPDGLHYEWTIVRIDGFIMLLGDLTLNASTDSYNVNNARVLNPAPNPTNMTEWSIRNSFNEGKSFYKGGTFLFACTRDNGGNLDDYVLDLATGNVTRATFNLEWDEDASFDPSGTYLMTGSARALHNQLRTMSSMLVPPFLDSSIYVTFPNASLGTYEDRKHVLEKWLVTAADEKAGRNGVLLNDKTGGWAAGASKNPWHPDGTKAVWGERGPGTSSRLVVISFPDFTPASPIYCQDPANEPECQTPTPSWAPFIDDYPMLEAGNYTIQGPGGGVALLSTSANVLVANSVIYTNFTYADGTILNGEMSISGNFITYSQDFSSNITVSGTHTGQSTYRVKLLAQGLICGEVNSTMDEKFLTTGVGRFNPLCNLHIPSMCPDGADSDGTEIGQSDPLSPNACAQDLGAHQYLANFTGTPTVSGTTSPTGSSPAVSSSKSAAMALNAKWYIKTAVCLGILSFGSSVV